MRKSNFSIGTLSSDSPRIHDIIDLADRNTKYLGFFPKSAWAEQAAKGHVLLATDCSKDTLLGYLLYYVARGRAVIQQLCVTDSARGQGVGRELVHTLIERTGHLHGIKLRCAWGFPAEKFWLQVGFQPIGEKLGRGKVCRWIVEFWLEHKHPDLFEEFEHQERETVVIDANVFFDLYLPEGHTNKVKEVFAVPWLEDLVEVSITREIFSEIRRQEDARQRQRALHWAKQFGCVDANHRQKSGVRGRLAAILGAPGRAQGRSDHEHPAITVAAGIKFFVTCDRKILSKSEVLAVEFGLRVMEPVTLLTHFNQQRSASEYEPARLGGSHIQRRRPCAEDFTRLVDTFHHSGCTERKHEFRDRLHRVMKTPDRVHASLVEEPQKTPIALLCGERMSDRLVLACVRCLGHARGPTVIRLLITEAILHCRRHSIGLIEVSEPQLEKINIRALRDLGFVQHKNTWLKVNVYGAMTVNQAAARLGELGSQTDQPARAVMERFQRALQSAHNTSVPGSYLLFLERQLSPLRLVDERLKNWIVPIQPRWARELFDYELAEDSLLPTEPDLALRFENVYYRSAAHGLLPEAPGHVLWYVSSSGDHGGPSAIRACSNIEESVIDVPDRLYANYERLGVYKLSDLQKIGGDIRRVLAFRFSGSELFAEQIVRQEFSGLCREFAVEVPPLSMPWRMPTEMFAEIYRRGTG